MVAKSKNSLKACFENVNIAQRSEATFGNPVIAYHMDTGVS